MPKCQFALVDDAFNQYRSQHVSVKVAETAWEKQGYFQLRKKTFQQEQKILLNEETDTNDFTAIPIIAMSSSWFIGDEVVGAVRIYKVDPGMEPDQHIWYGGRLCVTRAYRGLHSIGKALINEAVSRAKDLGCQRFLANVQPQNEHYFHSVHWQTIGPVEIAGKPHVHMIAELDKYPFMPRDHQ